MTHACTRYSYREAGAVVWRRCLDCGAEERGRWIRTATLDDLAELRARLRLGVLGPGRQAGSQERADVERFTSLLDGEVLR